MTAMVRRRRHWPARLPRHLPLHPAGGAPAWPGCQPEGGERFGSARPDLAEPRLHPSGRCPTGISPLQIPATCETSVYKTALRDFYMQIAQP